MALCRMPGTGIPHFAHFQEERVGFIGQAQSLGQMPDGVLLEHQCLKHAINQNVRRTRVIRVRCLVVGVEGELRVSNYVERATEMVPGTGVLEQSVLSSRLVDEVANLPLQFGRSFPRVRLSRPMPKRLTTY